MKRILVVASMLLSISLPVWANSADKNFDENDYLQIEKTTKQLKSRLSSTYDGYEYLVKNVYAQPVIIKRIDIWYNATGKVAYLSVKKTNKTAAGETFAKGKKYAVRTLGLSLIPYAIAAPFSAICNDIGNSNAEKESEEYDKKQIVDYIIKPSEKLSIKTMAMKRHSPVFKLIFVNPITDENMEMFLK